MIFLFELFFNQNNVQWEVKSTGTHVDRLNQPPDPRGATVMKKAGIYKYLVGKTAMLFNKSLWNDYDVIVTMDDNNYK